MQPTQFTVELSPADRRDLMRALKGQGAVSVEFSSQAMLAIGGQRMTLTLNESNGGEQS